MFSVSIVLSVCSMESPRPWNTFCYQCKCQIILSYNVVYHCICPSLEVSLSFHGDKCITVDHWFILLIVCLLFVFFTYWPQRRNDGTILQPSTPLADGTVFIDSSIPMLTGLSRVREHQTDSSVTVVNRGRFESAENQHEVSLRIIVIGRVWRDSKMILTRYSVSFSLTGQCYCCL